MAAATKQIRVFSARPDHPPRQSGEDSTVVVAVELVYLNNRPVAVERISVDKALELAEQLLAAARIVKRVNAEKHAEEGKAF